MRAIKWRAWVEDLATQEGFTLHQGGLDEWADLPADGIICVMIYFSDNAPSGTPLRRIAHGSDFYFMFIGHDGAWVIGDNSDTREEVTRRFPTAVIKRGKWISDGLMQDVIAMAMESRPL